MSTVHNYSYVYDVNGPQENRNGWNNYGGVIEDTHIGVVAALIDAGRSVA